MTGPDRVQGTAWVPEYSGNDCTWITWRTAYVWRKRRRTNNAAKTIPTP